MKIFGFEISIKRLRKETDKEIQERIRKLCKTDDLCNYSEDTMSGQTALNELCNYFLGKDWYVVDPLPNMQVNPIIVYEIERKYRKRI